MYIWCIRIGTEEFLPFNTNYVSPPDLQSWYWFGSEILWMEIALNVFKSIVNQNQPFHLELTSKLRNWISCCEKLNTLLCLAINLVFYFLQEKSLHLSVSIIFSRKYIFDWVWIFVQTHNFHLINSMLYALLQWNKSFWYSLYISSIISGRCRISPSHILEKFFKMMLVELPK
jgi:hypothetical protein